MSDLATSAIMSSLATLHSNVNTLNNNLSTVNSNVNYVNDRVNEVSASVGLVESEVTDLARKFADFLLLYNNNTQLTISHTEIIRIRQELEQKYGQYADVRKHTTGILQATDLGLVRKETINTATEELMLATPGYWLTPCLIALAAWIDDNPDHAQKALLEALKRDDEKTSLFFALICRRANRKQASLKWVQRYLEHQDAENLDHSAVIILDAFASGLLGADSEGLVSRQLTKWIDHLAEDPGFINEQRRRWSDAINLKRTPMENQDYLYLPKYSRTWPQLKQVMEGAQLHAELLEYFMNIFEQESSTDPLKAQLDEILDSLVNNYDEVEIPLRKEERLHTLIIEHKGDKARAEQIMKVEEAAFSEKKDFTQLLTDSAMNPETSHASPSTQKFAIALSKDWISDAYNDVTAQNRMAVPQEIEINVDSFNAKTTDGKNEQQLLAAFNSQIDREKETALRPHVLSGFAKFCLFGGIAVGVLGLILLFTGYIVMGLLVIAAGLGMVLNYNSKRKAVNLARSNVESFYSKKRGNGQQIIRATLAEVVDFRSEFATRDKESEKVQDFLEQITPEQYVKKLADSTRRIKVTD